MGQIVRVDFRKKVAEKNARWNEWNYAHARHEPETFDHLVWWKSVLIFWVALMVGSLLLWLTH